MTMTANGLAKLLEECGELTEAAAGLLSARDSAESARACLLLSDEAADVLAAVDLVNETFLLPLGISDGALYPGGAVCASSTSTTATQQLTDLIAALGALCQVSAKKLSYYRTDQHPDGKGSLQARLTASISAAVLAIIQALSATNADPARVKARRVAKARLFLQWHADPGNNPDAVIL